MIVGRFCVMLIGPEANLLLNAAPAKTSRSLIQMPARTLISVLFLATAATFAQASPVLWNLDGVIFSDGGAGSGDFVYEASTGTVLDWNLTTGAGGSFDGFVYTPTTSTARANVGGCAVDFIAARNTSFLCLNPASALVAGTAPDLLSSSFEFYASGLRTVASGSLEDPPIGGGAAVPEPAPFGFVAFALALATGLYSRRTFR